MNKRRKKSYCFNCKTSLGTEDNFCRKCGQENHDKKVSLKLLIKDFLGDYLTFDSKIWRSLKLLCFSPGQLTLLYSEGKITDYVRPIRLMLFMSLIYVISLSLYLDNTKPIMSNSNIQVGEEASVLDTYSNIVTNYEGVDDYIEKEIKEKPYLNKALTKGVYNLVGGNKNVVNEGLKKTSNLLLFLLPLVGILLKWAFWKDKQFYVEHFTHALHLYSFFFMLSIIAILLSWLFSIPYYAFLFVLISFYIYLYLSYKKVYERSWLITFFKVLTTSFSFLFMLFIGFIVSLIITISLS
jgi:hypothetical protein